MVRKAGENQMREIERAAVLLLDINLHGMISMRRSSGMGPGATMTSVRVQRGRFGRAPGIVYPSLRSRNAVLLKGHQ